MHRVGRRRQRQRLGHQQRVARHPAMRHAVGAQAVESRAGRAAAHGSRRRRPRRGPGGPAPTPADSGPAAVCSQAPQLYNRIVSRHDESVALPAFTDNYIWMLHDGADAVVVDPGRLHRCVPRSTRTAALAAILVTHHHADHVGGVDALRARAARPGLRPGARDDPGAVRRRWHDGDADRRARPALRGASTCRATPPGHIAYLTPATRAAAPMLFCGDTLFSAGCGRLFEGTPAQMIASLAPAGRAAWRHAGLLHARIHAVQPALRRGRRARAMPS